MSQLKVDTITDSAGTGAPSFTYGAQIFVPSDSSADADTVLTTSSSRLQRLTTCTGVRTYKLPSTGIKAGERWTFVNNATAANSVYVLITAADDSVVGVCHTGGNVTEIMALTNDPGTQSDWLVLRMKEYLFNTNTSSQGNNTVSFDYGPLGGSFINVTPSGTNVVRRVRAIVPVKQNDLVIAEYYSANQLKWVAHTAYDSNAGLDVYHIQNGVFYGYGISYVVAQLDSTKDIDVAFGKYAYNPGAYGSVGGAWSSFGTSAWKWRIAKITG